MKIILYVHANLDIGGAEMLRFLTFKYLDKSKYEATLCCIERKGVLAQKIEALGYKVVCLGRSSKPYNIFTTIALLRFLLKTRFDIVQTSLFNANFHGRLAAFFARVPVIISEEHSEHYQYVSWKFFPNLLADFLLALFTDKIISCSQNLSCAISRKENIPLSKFFALLNVVDPQRFNGLKSRASARKELGLAEADFLICNIASLSPRKGQHYLLEAFARVHEQLVRPRLIFVGREYRPVRLALQELAGKLKISQKVFFLGERKDALDILNASDLCVLSSIHEGLPLVILEAMYLGVAVISTQVGGIAEIVKDNLNGRLVSPGDVSQLSGAIAELSNNAALRSRLADEGKKTINNNFLPQRYMAGLDDLYDGLCREKIKCAE